MRPKILLALSFPLLASDPFAAAESQTLALLPNAVEAPAGAKARAIGDLNLDELLALTVTSVARKEETVFAVASAIDVLTTDQIRRTGANNIADALRYATGPHVANHTPRAWATSIRGFNKDSSNKLEVLMDGRSVYSPFFSGVFWDGVDYNLADVDRIEVIRGPGATMWGSNAMNGVINIYTKGAENTQGAMLRSTFGAPESFMQDARVGFQVGEKHYARVFAKYYAEDQTRLEGGEKSSFDPWEMFRLGFRSDYLPDTDSRLTTEGEFFSDKLGISEDFLQSYEGGHLLSRWERRQNADSSYEIQGYYDRYDRDYAGFFAERRQTADLSGQHRYQGFAGHDIVSGAGYRYSWDETVGLTVARLDPADEGFGVFNVFVQDEYAAREDVSLTFGAKFEHNSLVDRWEFQPSARAAWRRGERSVFWGAISRSVRTPARADTDLRWVQPGFQLLGQDDYKSEQAISYELGHRHRFGESLAVDISLFYNDYDDLPTVEPQGGGVYFYQSRQEGETWGGEISFDYRASYWASFSLDYAYLRESFSLKPGSAADPVSSENALGNDPESMATLGAIFDLPQAIEASAYLRYVGELTRPEVPSYLGFDLRLAWAPRPWVEIALIGKNLFDPHHPEFAAESPFRRQYPRTVQLQTTFTF